MNEEQNSALRKIEELEARLEMTQAKCSAFGFRKRDVKARKQNLG